MKRVVVHIVEKGYPTDEEIAGAFDNETLRAVRLFQSQNFDQNGQPLEVDGKVGELTWYQAQRVALWQHASPAATPTRALDLDKLCRLSMTGGSIRNIALNAAFLAAEAGQAVDIDHLLQGADADASKRERALADVETRGWA